MAITQVKKYKKGNKNALKRMVFFRRGFSVLTNVFASALNLVNISSENSLRKRGFVFVPIPLPFYTMDSKFKNPIYW